MGNHHLGFGNNTYSFQILSWAIIILLSASKNTGTHNNLKAKLVTVYGTTFTQHVFEPILRSFTGCSLEDLHPSANLPYLLTRLIVLGSEASIQIKKSDLYDSKIAWTKNSDGTSNILKLYPKSSSLTIWAAWPKNSLKCYPNRPFWPFGRPGPKKA